MGTAEAFDSQEQMEPRGLKGSLLSTDSQIAPEHCRVWPQTSDPQKNPSEKLKGPERRYSREVLVMHSVDLG